MEIIVLPYLAISFAIGWAIFSPFAELDDLQKWTFARIETGDILALFLPLSFLLAFVMAVAPKDTFSVPVLVLIAIAIFLYSLCGLGAGLFLLAKMESGTSSIKRMSMIGVVIPCGSLLSMAWIILPLWAFAGSILYAIPASIALIPTTLILRSMSGWICKT